MTTHYRPARRAFAPADPQKRRGVGPDPDAPRISTPLTTSRYPMMGPPTSPNDTISAADRQGSGTAADSKPEAAPGPLGSVRVASEWYDIPRLVLAELIRSG